MNNSKKIFILCFMLLISGLAQAETIGGIAGTLSSGGNVIAKVLWAACIIVGIILFFTAYTQYQIHRTNPKLVPLGVPVTYILLAIAAIIIPFAERIVDFIKDEVSVEENISADDADYSSIDEDYESY